MPLIPDIRAPERGGGGGHVSGVIWYNIMIHVVIIVLITVCIQIVIRFVFTISPGNMFKMIIDNFSRLHV